MGVEGEFWGEMVTFREGLVGFCQRFRAIFHSWKLETWQFQWKPPPQSDDLAPMSCFMCIYVYVNMYTCINIYVFIFEFFLGRWGRVSCAGHMRNGQQLHLGFV